MLQSKHSLLILGLCTALASQSWGGANKDIDGMEMLAINSGIPLADTLVIWRIAHNLNKSESFLDAAKDVEKAKNLLEKHTARLTEAEVELNDSMKSILVRSEEWKLKDLRYQQSLKNYNWLDALVLRRKEVKAAAEKLKKAEAEFARVNALPTMSDADHAEKLMSVKAGYEKAKDVLEKAESRLNLAKSENSFKKLWAIEDFKNIPPETVVRYVRAGIMGLFILDLGNRGWLLVSEMNGASTQVPTSSKAYLALKRVLQKQSAKGHPPLKQEATSPAPASTTPSAEIHGGLAPEADVVNH